MPDQKSLNQYDDEIEFCDNCKDPGLPKETTLSALLDDNGYKVYNFSGVERVLYLWKSILLVAIRKEA